MVLAQEHYRSRPGVAQWLARLDYGVSVALLTLVGTLAVVVAAQLGWTDRAAVALPALAVLPLAILALLVHEGGHLIVGRLVGFRFVALTLGPLVITATTRHRHVSWVAGQWRTWFAWVTPLHPAGARSRFALVVAGGPFANLLAATVLALLARALPVAGVYLALLVVAACVQATCGLANLLPFTERATGMPSDGAQLRTLLADPHEAARRCAFAALLGAMVSGRSADEVDPAWITQATAWFDESPTEALATFLAFSWAAERDDLAAADNFLQRAVAASAHLPAGLRAVLAAEEAFFVAYYRSESTAARDALNRVDGGLEPSHRHLRFLAETAILAIEGRNEDAMVAAKEGLAAMEVANDRTSHGRMRQRRWLEDVLAANGAMVRYAAGQREGVAGGQE